VLREKREDEENSEEIHHFYSSSTIISNQIWQHEIDGTWGRLEMHTTVKSETPKKRGKVKGTIVPVLN
jgi:hypothetical protein